MSKTSPKHISPWVMAVTLPASDEELARLVRVKPEPLAGIHEMRPQLAREMLTRAIERTYLPSAQELRVIRRLFDIACAHARLAMGSEQQFIDGIRRAPATYLDVPMCMLTGLPGVGKSALIRAVMRLVASDLEVTPSKGLDPFRVKPIVQLDIKSNIKFADLLNETMRSAGIDESFKSGDPKDFRLGGQRLYQVGACLIFVDETQFLNRSSGASTLTVKILSKVAEFQLPTLFACNFSLGHKLKMRPPEDVTRLMSSPIILLPDLATDPAFVGYLDDIKVVMDGALNINSETDSAEIHAMTFGLRRLVIRLITCAYVIAREHAGKQRTRPSVTMQHLRAAYWHTDYQTDRLAVEQCQSAALGFSDVSDNFLCPFELPPTEMALQKAHAEQLRQVEFNDAIHKASMNGEERAADRAAQIAARARAKREGIPVPKAKPRPQRPKKPTTAAEWRATFDAN